MTPMEGALNGAQCWGDSAWSTVRADKRVGLSLNYPRYPQTLRATRATSSNFRCISSHESRLPEAAEANPHWVLTARSSGVIYLEADSMRWSNSSSDSSFDSLVVTKPRTTVLPLGTNLN